MGKSFLEVTKPLSALQATWERISRKDYLATNFSLHGLAVDFEMQFYLAYRYLTDDFEGLNKITPIASDLAEQHAVIRFMTSHLGFEINSDVSKNSNDSEEFELIKQAVQSNTNEQQIRLLKDYIRTYPQIMKTLFPWPHRYEDLALKDTYTPVWHFNVAAISIMLGLDIEDFADEPFYPIELARYCLAQRQNKS